MDWSNSRVRSPLFVWKIRGIRDSNFAWYQRLLNFWVWEWCADWCLPLSALCGTKPWNIETLEPAIGLQSWVELSSDFKDLFASLVQKLYVFLAMLLSLLFFVFLVHFHIVSKTIPTGKRIKLIPYPKVDDSFGRVLLACYLTTVITPGTEKGNFFDEHLDS